MLLRTQRDHWADAAPRLYGAAAELLLDALPPLQPQSRFLEICAGPGMLARPLAERLAGLGRLIAVEEDPALARSLPSARGRSAAVVASPERLPFAPGSFDVALGNLAVGDPADDGARLSELKRTLRPGGWLLLTVLLKGSFDELLDVLTEACEAEALPDARQALLDARASLPDLEGLKAALGEAGLPVMHVGVEERALFFPGAAAAFADPLVRELLVPSWLVDLALPDSAYAAAVRAAETYLPGPRFSVRVRTAICTSRAERRTDAPAPAPSAG